MCVDVSAAVLYGDIKRDVYIELPSRDPRAKTNKWVGKLFKAMYGTRDAPQVWYEEVRRLMVGLGFTQSLINPCLYFHSERTVRVLVHVDDFLCTGTESNLECLGTKVAEKFKIKRQMLGMKNNPFGELTFLGRSIRWKRHGIEVEGDTKHVEALIKDWGMEQAKELNFPDFKDDPRLKEEFSVEMDSKEATRFRRSAARVNYLSMERPDIGHSSKEIAKCMANPMVGDEWKLKRWCIFLG